MGSHLLLLPGFDGTGQLFLPLQRALGSSVNCTVVRYSEERSFEEYVSTAARALPEKDAVLVAESFSGPVAVALMSEHASRISCAVLCATFARSPFRLLAGLAGRAPSRLHRPSTLQGLMLRHFCLNGESNRALFDQARFVAGSLSAAAVRNRLRVLAHVDVRSLVRDVPHPILYLRATRDRIVSASRSRELTRDCRRVITKDIDGPHLLLQTRPSECARQIMAFLSETMPGLAERPQA